MKYLGLLLDGRWTIEDHFEQLAPPLEQTGVALCRLLPNIGGPDELTIRMVRGYRTVSYEAFSVLEGLLPLELLAGMEARTYGIVRRRPSGLPSLGPVEADNITKEI
ncbi:uncharacterized protein LOC143219921 [Lasioglossum baleicum]|uniref:uncharacterized protein LOC143219921 n=1 Tax=Lasioglossum baleicum TaxID=434251 RepID=UPI003FCEAB32